MTLYDRLVPAEALRWGRLTAVWPWQPVRPHLWEAATDPSMPPGVVEFEGHRYPLVEFMDEPTPARYRLDRWSERRGINGDSLIIDEEWSESPQARPWLPWRKRR